MFFKVFFSVPMFLAIGITTLLAGTVVLEKEAMRPLQPFLVELLDQERGNWNFLEPLGQRMKHPGEVTVSVATVPEAMKAAVLLLDDPEFPGEAAHAEFREFPAVKPGRFELRISGFQADLFLKPDGRGILSNIRLGSAGQSERIPAALYVTDGTKWIPVRLEGKYGGLKLQSDRVGSVFVGNEPIKLHAIRLGKSTPVEAEYVITDYFRSREVVRGKVRLDGEDTLFSIPLEKFGSFVATIKLPGYAASLRITRIPEPQKLDPEHSFVGMNIFQQQMWYYSYQLPLFARAGVRWVRPWLHWESAWKNQEPRKGVFDTAQLDILLRRLKKYNQKFVYILYTFSPVLGLASVEKSPLNETQMERWLEYVKRIVAHCGDVRDWEIWNEPDGTAKAGMGFDADFYRDFLKKTAEAVRQIRPNARIHGISHAIDESWLRAFCQDPSMAEVIDVITLHTYAPFASFTKNEIQRQRILDIGGFCGKPQQFNEIGVSAYDGCPEYLAAFPNTTERRQAEVLPINWAQSLYFGGPQGKAYWFCSLDPRDSTNPKQRTGDSGYGLLYQGFQPKIAYAALAGMAKLLDGHKCVGQMEVPDTPIRYAVFSGGRAVIWSDILKGEITATMLGCLPGEKLTTCDLFGNPTGCADAENLTLSLNDGPVFLLGCSSLEKKARTVREEWIRRRAMIGAAERRVGTPVLPELKIGESRKFEFSIPEKSHVSWKISHDFPGRLQCRQERGRVFGEIAAGTESGAGTLIFSVKLADMEEGEVKRILPVSVGRRNFIPDGGFDSGNLNAFQQIPMVWYENRVGADAPGCLKFSGPFDGRLHLYAHKSLKAGRALHFKAKIRGHLTSGTRVSFNVAMFGNGGWKGTWVTASQGEVPADSRNFQLFTAKIPNRIEEWTSLSAMLPASRLPEGHISLVFFIDCRGGAEGDFLLIDDLMLYQDEVKTETAGMATTSGKIRGVRQ